MKKTAIKVIALTLVAVMACMFLASCGTRISGKYSAEALGTGATMEFKGSKVTTTYKALGVEVYSVEGEYEIKDDKITITYSGDDADKAKDYAGTFDFEKGDDYIKIGVFKFEEVDD